jgi:glycosyltransferase involved in cell wall biosynthesis
MRILHVLNEVVDTGNGIVNATVDLACTQASSGNDVWVISSGGGYVEFLARNNVRHVQINLRPRSVLQILRDLPRLKTRLNEIQPDIVHAHMMTGAVLMRLGRTIGGFGNYGLVTTVHNEWRHSSHLMRVGDRIIVLSKNAKLTFRQRGFAEHKLCVVSHGILNSPRRMGELQANDETQTLRNAAPLIITVAGMYVRKGIGDLIQAFGQIAGEFPNAGLLIVGWGPAQKQFEEQSKSVEGSSRIKFKGFVASPRALLRQAAIFVLASHTESFPLAIAEAREAGCAVIGTRVGGVPELLEDGKAGLLVPPSDVEALATVLRRLLRDPQELISWQRAARANMDWLSCARMERDTMDVYLSLLRETDANNVGQGTVRLSGRTID